MRALLKFAVPWLGVCALVFLFASGFFTSWYGTAVSVRPPARVDPPVLQVLIAEQGGWREVEWPADAVEGLGLPYDAAGVPPPQLDPGLPATRKPRFQLQFMVEQPNGEWRHVGTTSPRSLGLAIIVLVLGIGVRNMAYGGSPVSITPREVYLPPEQQQAGSAPPPPTTGNARPRKGPPPARPRRGRGRGR